MDSSLEQVGRLAAGPMDGCGVSRDEALALLELAEQDLQAVLYHADRIRRRHRGNVVRLCGIVAAKVGRCSEDCAWCSQSVHHRTGIAAHDLLDEETLLQQARSARDVGADSFGFVTSGAAPTPSEVERLCRVMATLATEDRIAPCASLGLLDETTAGELARAGCRRYNHNLETSRRHFARVVTTHSYDQRIETARAVKAAGMELCCGGLFGIGETVEDRVDLALEVRRLDADTVPINFLNPVPGTPAAAAEPLTPRQCLATVAMMRFVLPTKCLKLAGGREVALRDLQSWMFAAGADGCIVGNYLTTAGRSAEADLQMIADLGLVAEGRPAPNRQKPRADDVQ
jgi:biotin synthase